MFAVSSATVTVGAAVNRAGVLGQDFSSLHMGRDSASAGASINSSQKKGPFLLFLVAISSENAWTVGKEKEI